MSQTGAGKFSYCLTPYDSDGKAASHLFVGASANLAGESPVVSIKFVKNPTDPPYNGVYFLPLVVLTVGETKLPIPSSLSISGRSAPGTGPAASSSTPAAQSRRLSTARIRPWWTN